MQGMSQRPPFAAAGGPTTALLLFVLLQACAFFVQAQQNLDIVRKVDLTMAVVRSQATIRVSDLQGSYIVSFPAALAPKLSFLQVVLGGNQVLFPTRMPDAGDGLAHYDVQVPGGMVEATFQVFATFAGALKPLPAEIAQSENQLVQYFDSHTVPSLYPTTTQTSTFTVGISHIESFTKTNPYAMAGQDLSFGPFPDVAGGAESLSPFMIHYQNNAPFAKALQAIREIEVSHWGNVAFEEFVEVHHAGAVLKGGFSRLDYQMGGSPSAFQGLVAVLPSGARNIYYRDQIGNISTSSIRYRPHGVELDLQSRFPLFGGWKNQFYQGYSVPVEELLVSGVEGDANQYALTVPFSVPFSELWVEELTVKVVLPEWATNMQVQLPFDVDEEYQTSRLTFLDTSLSGGRPVVVLKKRNVVAEHIQPMIITYSFPKRAMLLEPLYLVLAFFFFFLVCMLFARVDLRVTPDSEKVKKSKTH